MVCKPHVYSFVSFYSTDIDECSTGGRKCHVNALCENYPGSYSCRCNSGYSGNGEVCTGKSIKNGL